MLKKGDRVCGFPAVRAQVKYPPTGPIIIPGNPSAVNFKRDPSTSPVPPPFYNADHCDFDDGGTNTPERLAYIMNDTNNKCYGACDPYDAIYNYFLAPSLGRAFQSYNIEERGRTDLYFDDAYVAYLNRADVQDAIHAPRLLFTSCNNNLSRDLGLADRFVNHPQPPAYQIVPTLISQGVKVHIFSGVLDFAIPHTGQELVLQNMTWGGSQGFSRLPNSVVFDGAQGREERGLSYYSFNNAGHRVAQDSPQPALRWLIKVVVKGPNAAWAWS